MLSLMIRRKQTMHTGVGEILDERQKLFFSSSSSSVVLSLSVCPRAYAPLWHFSASSLLEEKNSAANFPLSEQLHVDRSCTANAFLDVCHL